MYRRGAALDTQAYRNGYPGKKDDMTKNKNLDFYRGDIVCVPDRVTIEEIHEDWWGQYRKLEWNHGYIQWLFPIREQGLNFRADELQLHEARSIAEDPKLQRKILKSYEMMLDFYGMQLDRKTGEVCKSDGYAERYYNLSTSGHNFLRITRILKCLGEVGLESYKLPWLKHFYREVLVTKDLKAVESSLRGYWAGTLRNPSDVDELDAYVAELTTARKGKKPCTKKSSRVARPVKPSLSLEPEDTLDTEVTEDTLVTEVAEDTLDTLDTEVTEKISSLAD
eukprot:TRINITY_DN1587_c1_g2_i1.p1 TRINITY_DN1587_c1_g2~~TRINITY_DN1587_c1_g2_i1.p1  ORF type:complete len:299 (+),score=71.44 TRINITY_DN1587_c1_g2_i1:58-897(+)